MNEHAPIDPAFAPVDEAHKPQRGPNPDGTISFEITEGKVYRDGVEEAGKEVVGYVQVHEAD